MGRREWPFVSSGRVCGAELSARASRRKRRVAEEERRRRLRRRRESG